MALTQPTVGYAFKFCTLAVPPVPLVRTSLMLNWEQEISR